MPSPAEILADLDGYALWISAVVAGATAVGFVTRRAWRASRALHRRMTELGRKIDALDVLAGRELTDGGDSMKSLTRQSASIALAVEDLQIRVTALELLTGRVRDLEEAVHRLEEWRDRWKVGAPSL